jgi:hypothetical protein
VEGRWGHPWVSMVSSIDAILTHRLRSFTKHRLLCRLIKEKEFEVYEPYCANYLNAIALIEKEKENLDVRS